jgi:hypothetical protein
MTPVTASKERRPSSSQVSPHLSLSPISSLWSVQALWMRRRGSSHRHSIYLEGEDPPSSTLWQSLTNSQSICYLRSRQDDQDLAGELRGDRRLSSDRHEVLVSDLFSAEEILETEVVAAAVVNSSAAVLRPIPFVRLTLYDGSVACRFLLRNRLVDGGLGGGALGRGH